MGPGSWVLPAAGGIVLSVVVMSVLGLLSAALALAIPARRQGSTPLRVALVVSPPEVSRRAALAAWMRWLKAYMSTSRGLRLARILVAAMAAPTGLASARWRRRAVLLTSRGGCLRVLVQPDGSWRVVDVAGWPVGGRGRGACLSACAPQPTVPGSRSCSRRRRRGWHRRCTPRSASRRHPARCGWSARPVSSRLRLSRRRCRGISPECQPRSAAARAAAASIGGP